MARTKRTTSQLRPDIVSIFEVSMDHIRHSAIYDASHLTVTLIGAGGIGAMTALCLAKMGVGNLIVYDDDTVSEANMPTQLHRLGDLGREKVFGLEEIVQTFSDDTAFYPEDIRITADMQLFSSVVVSAVDSIQARKDIWQAVMNGNCGFYLDARMSAEEFHLFSVDLFDPGQIFRYNAKITGEDDSQVPDIPCTAKATFYTAAMAAGHIGSAVRKIASGEKPTGTLVHNIFRDKLFALEL